MVQDVPEIAASRDIDATFAYAYYFASDNKKHVQRVVGEHDMLNVILGGCYRLKAGGQDITARKGDVVFAPRALLRQEWNEPPEPLRCLAIFFRWASPPEGIPLVCRDKLGRMRTLAGWLHAERGVSSPLRTAVVDAYLRAILGEYVRLWQEEVEHEWVREVRAYVQGHIGGRITLDALAAHLHVSKYHFIRRFKQLTGETPLAAVRRMRVETARELALGSRMTLSEIARRVGVANPYHMSRLFKETFGVGVRGLRGAGSAGGQGMG
jgi:AraC-like DNA-binding protein